MLCWATLRSLEGDLKYPFWCSCRKSMVGVWSSFRNYCSLGEPNVPNCSWPCSSSVKDSTPKTSHTHFPLGKSLQLLRLLSKDSINSS